MTKQDCSALELRSPYRAFMEKFLIINIFNTVNELFSYTFKIKKNYSV